MVQSKNVFQNFNRRVPLINVPWCYQSFNSSAKQRQSFLS